MEQSVRNLMQQIPKVDRILAWPELRVLLGRHPRAEVLSAVRTVLESVREQVKHDGDTAGCQPARFAGQVAALLASRARPGLRPVINGSGVVVHTNLGRSPLADEAESALRAVAPGYSNLEYDLEGGERGSRGAHIEELVCELTGAESALVVNNNAAAVLLALSSLARGREAIVSRGELVEIGGSFRIPDVMAQSGARLVEVGTTNRTRIGDYKAALTDATALFLKVHSSNFAMVGFTAEASLEDLAALGRSTGIPVMMDAGSGCLLDLSRYGIRGEPTVRQCLESGADLVTFSGDKLLGGPQAGLIAGTRQFVDPMKRHPLLRALRMDKLGLAALEATLRLYRDERRAVTDIPTLRMLTMNPGELARRAGAICRRLRGALPAGVTFHRHPGESSAGGGSYPLLELPTTLIEIRVAGCSPQRIEAALRRTEVPVIGRIQRDRFLLDVRTIQDRDLPCLARSMGEACRLLTEDAG